MDFRSHDMEKKDLCVPNSSEVVIFFSCVCFDGESMFNKTRT